jgi:hypothetical protein
MDPTDDRARDVTDDPDPTADTVELCPCPECGLPAEVVVGDRLAAGQLVGVRCIDRHWFFGLRERLVA